MCYYITFEICLGAFEVFKCKLEIKSTNSSELDIIIQRGKH